MVTLPRAGRAAQGSGTRRATRPTVIVLCAAGTAYSVLQSLVVPALGTLQRHLHTTTTGTGWIFTAYLLSASVLAPVIGRLGDLYGKRRALVWSLLALAAGSGVSALATSLPLMLAGRLVQGAGGAVFPLAFAIVRDHLPPGQRARAIAMLSAVLTVGGALGTLAAGPIVALLSYHWLFGFPALFATAAAIAAATVLPETSRVAAARIGASSAVLLAGWLTLLLLATTEVPTGRLATVASLAAGALLLAALWVVRELRSPQPLVDLRTLWQPPVRAVNAATLLLGFGMFAAWMSIPLLVQQDPASGVGFGAPAAAVGLYLLPTAAGTVAVTPLAGRLADARGPRSALFLGALAASAGYLWMALAHHNPVSLIAAILVEGGGVGLAFAAVAVRAVESVPAAQTGVAAGLNTIMRTIGGTLGTSLTAVMLATRTTARGQPTDAAYTLAFMLFGAALAGCAAVGLARRPTAHPTNHVG